MACLLGSCFSDNGNYDYQPPINIRVTGVNEAYTVNPTGDKLQIAPKIYPENRQYDCFMERTGRHHLTATRPKL